MAYKTATFLLLESNDVKQRQRPLYNLKRISNTLNNFSEIIITDNETQLGTVVVVIA